MAINGEIKVLQAIGQVIKVKQTEGILSTSAPITLRNTSADYNTIDELVDVDLVSRANNSTLIYNAITDKYEVKPLNSNIITITSIDGGSF